MAEWIILILLLVLCFGAYEFNRRVYETQSLLVWGIVALIMALSLLVYIFGLRNRAVTALDREQGSAWIQAPPSNSARR